MDQLNNLDPEKARHVLISTAPIPCAQGCCSVSTFLRPEHTDAWVWHQVFVEQEYGFITQLGAWKPGTILDAGANIGLASVFFAELYPNATIVAVEPDPANFKLLELNTARYGNVRRVNAGLWPKRTGLALDALPCDGPPTLCGSWSIAVREVAPEQAQIQATTVPALLALYNLSSFDFMKIDIEGSEKAVFSRASGWVSNAHVIMVETHDWGLSGTADTVAARMSSEKYVRQQHGEFMTFVKPHLLPEDAKQQ